MTQRPTTPIPGYNVDRVNIEAGVRRAIAFGWDAPADVMVVGYALQRHARGEEDGCQRTMLEHGIDLTSYYAILAAALAAAYVPKHAAHPRPDDPWADVPPPEPKSWPPLPDEPPF